MKRFGLIGDPIGHSQSPALFKAAYGGKYPYDLIEGADFEASWKKFLDGYDGINVTAPFKELAYAKVDVVSPEVDVIGATNLVVKAPEGITAYNSDYLGVLAILKEEQTTRPIRSVLIVGCGGAAKAAAAAAFALEMDVTIANRSVDKAEAYVGRLEMAGMLRPCSAKGSVKACALTEMPDADMTIYCLPMRVDGIEKLHTRIFMEANYRDPAFSQKFFSEDVIFANETVYIGGGRWLTRQAETGYGLLTGEAPDSEALSKIL